MTLLQGFLLLLLVAFLAGAVAWSLHRLDRLAAIGAAYKAKVVSAVVFGTGRSVDPSRLDEVSADSYWPMRLFRCSIDPQAQSVTASLWGFSPRTVVFNEFADNGRMPSSERTSPNADRTGPAADPLRPAADRAWSVTAQPAIDRVVAAAFLEPNRRRLRRTRAVLVLHEGRIVAERYSSGFNERTRFPGWSMTKSVLGALLGVLVADGRLALSDRALMPGWQEPDPRAAIRVEDLLRMRSGLAFSEDYADLASDVIEMLFNQADTAEYAASRPLVAPPGTVWSYASGTTNILSAIARRIVGEAAYTSWPRRALFSRIGMASALVESDASGTFVASSFMLATARDWARLGQLYLQDGEWDGQRILPEGWVRFNTTPTPQSPDGIYGAHWWLGLKPELGGGTAAAARLPRDTFFAVGHEAQVLTVIPSRRLVVIRLGLSIYIDAWNHASFLAELLDALPG
jgi:CubicO group peptidase (beta-lactamase class C family)